MDVLSVVGSTLTVLQLASKVLTTSSQDGWEKIPWEHENYFLQVFDVSWAGGIDSSVLIDISGPTRLGESLRAAPQALPAQEPGSFRFYIGESINHMEDFWKYVARILPDPSTEDYRTHLGSPSFARLRSQWNSQTGSLAWLSRSYGMSDMTPHQLSSQASLRPSLYFSASLMRFSKSVRIFKDAHGCVSIFILSISELVELDDFFHDLPRDADIPSRPSQIDICSHLSQFCTSLRKTLTAKPLRCMAKGTNSHDTLIQLVLLVFCQCSLDQLSDFVDTAQHFYALFRERVTDPRRTVMTNSSLQEIIRDAYFYEQLQDCISDLASATEPLLELLHISFAARPEFKYLATEMRATCADLTKSSTRLSTRLDSHLHLFELLRNFNESLSVWLLGLLASVFLPLSLASSLLSMQSRLADLHFLLYDFCGVIVLLGTIVLIIVILLRVYARLAERLVKSKSNPGFRIWIYPFIRFNVWGWSFAAWGLLVSSFLVGMVRDVGLGLRILGYGTAVIGGLLVFAVVGAVVMWMFIKRIK